MHVNQELGTFYETCSMIKYWDLIQALNETMVVYRKYSRSNSAKEIFTPVTAKSDQGSGHVLCEHLPVGSHDLNILGFGFLKKPIPGLVKAMGSKFSTQCVQKLQRTCLLRIKGKGSNLWVCMGQIPC